VCKKRGQGGGEKGTVSSHIETVKLIYQDDVAYRVMEEGGEGREKIPKEGN